MENYEVRYKQSVYKELDQIPNWDVERILRRIENLREDPRPPGVEKLSGQNSYRVRQGVYRIIYEVHDRELVVIVVRVGHRKDVYRR